MKFDIQPILDELGLYNITPYELFRMMEHDVPLFSQVIMPHHLKTGEIPDFHKKIYALLQKNKRLNAIVAPRKFSKTTIITIYAIHEILYGHVKHLLYISETCDMAKEQVAVIKHELMTNKRIQLFWGNLSQKPIDVREELDYDYYDQVEKIRITQDLLECNIPIISAKGIKYQGILVRARGTGQQIRGRKRGTQRPDLIIADDLESENNLRTPESRLFTKKWWGDACRLSLADEGRAIMIANYTHEDCLIKNIAESRLLKGNPAYEAMMFRAVKNYDDNKTFDWKDAEPLWEKRFPIPVLLEYLNEFRAEDNVEGFWKEMMQVCVASEHRYFKRRNYYEGEYLNQSGGYMNLTRRNDAKVDINKLKVYVYIGCDPAVGKSPGADYFALTPIAVDSNDNCYKLPSFGKRNVGPKQAEDEIVNMCRNYSEALRYLVVEKNGFQEYLVYNLKNRFNKEGLNVKIVPIENRSHKTGPKRIGMLVPMNEDGRIWIKETDQQIKEEMHGYPNAKHEHLLDAMQMAIRVRKKPEYNTLGAMQFANKRPQEKPEYNWWTASSIRAG